MINFTMLFVCSRIFINAFLTLCFFFQELTLNPPEGIVAGPINEENFFEWEALIV